MEDLTTPVAPPAPAPSSAPAAPAVMTAPVPASTSGDSGIMETLKQLNWVEIGFGILGTAALFYTVYYYRYNINNSRKVNMEMQNKIDDLTMKLSDVEKQLEQNQQPQSQVYI